MGKHVCTCCGLLWIVSDLYICVSLFLCSTFSVFHFSMFTLVCSHVLQHLPCSHPHEQKVKDEHISNELRQGRSAQWLTKRVQVANDGAILLTGKTYRNKQQLKRDREQGQRRSQLPRWPNSRPGSSGGDKSAPGSGVVVQRQQPRRKKKWSERVTFGKKYGRGITAGNVSGGPVLLVFCCVCCRRLMFVVFCCSLLFFVVLVVLCCSWKTGQFSLRKLVGVKDTWKYCSF